MGSTILRPTPSVRSTYGGSARKRRRLEAAVDEESSQNERSTSSPEYEGVVTPTNELSTPKIQRLPQPRRFQTPPPFASQTLCPDLADAFEMASPGSATGSRDKRDIGNDKRQAPSLQSSMTSPVSELSNVTCSPLRQSFAARMKRAQRPRQIPFGEADVLVGRSLVDEVQEKASTFRPRASPEVERANGEDASQTIAEEPPSQPQNHSAILTLDHEGRSRQNAIPTLSRPSASLEVLQSPSVIKRTYGGTTRSHLAEAGASDQARAVNADVDSLLRHKTSGHELQGSYADMRQKGTLEAGEMIHLENADPAIRSLTTLRSAGSMKRFLDELDYILAGLDAKSSISSRRSSAFELVSRLCNADESAIKTDEEPAKKEKELESNPCHFNALDDHFLRNVKLSGSSHRIWRALRAAGAGDGADAVLDWSLSVILVHLLDGNAMGAALLDIDAEGIMLSAHNITVTAIRRLEGESSGSIRPSPSERQLLSSLEALSHAAGLGSDDIGQAWGNQTIASMFAVHSICLLALNDPSTTVLDYLSPEPISLSYRDFNVKSGLLSQYARLLHLMATEVATNLAIRDWHTSLTHQPRKAPGHRPRLIDTNSLAVFMLDTAAAVFEMGISSLENSINVSMMETRLVSVEAVKPLVEDIVVCMGYLNLAQRAADGSPAFVRQPLSALSGWLRVLVFYTQENTAWTAAVMAAPSSLTLIADLVVGLASTDKGKNVDSHHAEADTAFALRCDVICLALALLINLLENDTQAASKLYEVSLPRHVEGEHGTTSADSYRKNTLAIFSLLDLAVEDRPPLLARSQQQPSSDATSDLMRGAMALVVGLSLNGSERPIDASFGSGMAERVGSLSRILDAFALQHRRFRAELSHSTKSTASEASNEDITTKIAADMRELAVELAS